MATTVDETALSGVSCLDFTLFKATLVAMRKTDEARVNTIGVGQNAPSKDECSALYSALQAMFAARKAGLKTCIGELNTELDALSAEAKAYPDDAELADDVNSLKWKLDVLDNEVDFEDIAERQAMDAFRNKCRSFRIPRAHALRRTKPDPTTYVPDQ